MLKTKKILLVVADARQAQFYIAGPHLVSHLCGINDPDSHYREHELTSKEHDVNTCPYETKDTKKEHEKQNFSKAIVATMEKLFKDNNLDEICICATSKIIGAINKDKLNTNIKITEINKDLTHISDAKELQKAIGELGLSFINPAK